MNNTNILPYGRHCLDTDDTDAVLDVLRSSLLTGGHMVEAFESAICSYTGAAHGVAVSSGTAALHAAMHALGIGVGDEVIVSPMTFAASGNCVLYCGGTPVFVDVLPDSLLIDPEKVREAITPRTKAVIAVDYAGQPCQWDELRRIADERGIRLVADACHSLGGEFQGRKVGTLADISVFSFHAVKNITTGEGGMCVTGDAHLASVMRRFRSHGIDTTAAQREATGTWAYAMTELGYNYRITDFQCALGLSQLKKLPEWVRRRNSLADLYTEAFADSVIRPLKHGADCLHARHLYVVRVPERDRVISMLRKEGIGANVHYIPVFLHPYYQKRFSPPADLCPHARAAYGEILTLPLWPGMQDADVTRVVNALKHICAVGAPC